MWSVDICPKCNCNNAPMVWLGKDRGWICEDCYEKEVSENANISDNHNHNMLDNRDSCNNRK